MPMGDTRTFIDQGVVHAQKAIDYDRAACADGDAEKYDNAKNCYLRAIDYYYTALKYEKNEKTKAILREKINSYISRAEVMKEWLEKYEEVQKSQNDSSNSGSAAGGGTAAKSKDKKQEENEEEKLQAQLGSAVLTEKPNVRWDDIAGLEGAKDALKEAVILPQKFPQMFVGKRRPWKGILLYGPPGTGKSYLAKAVATEADAKFFSVSSSDLVSKWQGESEKLVKELFGMARSSGKAIIFIDEIDALVSSRSDSESESSRRIKTEFLVQMDGVGKSTDGVLLLGATNIPWGLDDALLRRMERRIYIPLPEEHARAAMFKLHIGNTPCDLSEEDYKELAAATEGYSGADIGILVRDAIMQPVRTLQNATFFKPIMVEEEGKGTVRKLTPCSPGDPEGKPMDLMSVEPSELHVPMVCRRDFELALESTKPSVGRDNIEKHLKFTSEKGQSGV
eukprot:GFKZ01004686.1.p1 GENE.GFKZ01004686.1~~GFKZ01004686.1.p1  ORF type:complete len:451 (-),score=87.30 GFKZ01004686.1:1358-2710(-)